MAETARAPVLPENVRDLVRAERAWNGVRLAVTEFHCVGDVTHRMGSPGETHLSTLLEEVGGRCEPRLRRSQPCPIPYVPRHMTLVPAGMEVWGHGDKLRFARDATLHFDLQDLQTRLDTDFDADGVQAPRLRFADDHAWTLIRLLADVVGNPDPSTQLYGDSLVAAVGARLFTRRRGADGGDRGVDSAGLAPWQLRRVVELLNERLPHRVELSELAELTRLSQSHFSKAFKASTGLAPYRWQLDARIRRAQALLIDTDASLEHVASATGFADAVHLGRTFRKFVGAPPGAWRADRKR